MVNGGEGKKFTYPKYFKDMVKKYYPDDAELHERIEANMMELPTYFVFPVSNKEKQDNEVHRMRSWLSDEWGRIIEIHMDGETEYGW